MRPKVIASLHSCRQISGWPHSNSQDQVTGTRARIPKGKTHMAYPRLRQSRPLKSRRIRQTVQPHLPIGSSALPTAARQKLNQENNRLNPLHYYDKTLDGNLNRHQIDLYKLIPMPWLPRPQISSHHPQATTKNINDDITLPEPFTNSIR